MSKYKCRVLLAATHISKPITVNNSLHRTSNNNRLTVAKLATLKYLMVQSTKFPNQSAH
jgi:hypothetical protein